MHFNWCKKVDITDERLTGSNLDVQLSQDPSTATLLPPWIHVIITGIPRSAGWSTIPWDSFCHTWLKKGGPLPAGSGGRGTWHPQKEPQHYRTQLMKLETSKILYPSFMQKVFHKGSLMYKWIVKDHPRSTKLNRSKELFCQFHQGNWEINKNRRAAVHKHNCQL